MEPRPDKAIAVVRGNRRRTRVFLSWLTPDHFNFTTYANSASTQPINLDSRLPMPQ